MDSKNKYLGEEKISKLLLKFSIPCITGLLISALYNIVDQIFIGNSDLGYFGNAATGVSFPVICIANAFAWCVGDGAAAYLSICAGRKDVESAHKCVGTGIIVTSLISIALLIVCQIFATPLMNLFGASEQTLDMSVRYFRIIVAFFPFYLLLNVMNSMIRADGSPKFAMIAMLTGAIVNIILDPLFIFVFKWGIDGAAWATALGQCCSFALCVIYFFKPKSFVLSKESFKIDKTILGKTISLGAATFITQIAIVIVTLISNITLAHYGSISKYGQDIPISIFSIQTKVFIVVCNITVGIVLGGQPIFGYNYGAHKYDRVKKAYKIVLLSTILIGAFATLIFQLWPEIIINIFGDGNELYQEFAIKTFRIYLMFMTITCLVKMTAIFFQSIGKSISAVVSSLIRDILLFTPLVIVLSTVLEENNPGEGINGILYAAPIADFISIFVILILTLIFFKKLNKMEQPVLEENVTISESTPGIIITISREHGSKGRQIANAVANKLNIPFYDKKIIALTAQESGLSNEFISNIDNNAPSLLYDLYLSTEVIKQSIIAQETIVKKIADKGSCVIVGRASDYILRDYDNLLNIFIHAPKETRVKNIMEMYNDTEEKAIENMKRSDFARSSYYKKMSGNKWGDPHNYTLCLDSSLGVEYCTNQICEVYELMNNKQK